MGDEGTLAAMARGQMTRILFIFSGQGGEARREGLKICSQGLTWISSRSRSLRQ